MGIVDFPGLFSRYGYDDIISIFSEYRQSAGLESVNPASLLSEVLSFSFVPTLIFFSSSFGVYHDVY